MFGGKGSAMPLHPRLALAALPLVLTGATAPPERVIRVGQPVATTINGTPGTVVIDPGAPSIPMISKALAERAALKPGMFAIGWGIGPVTVRARTAVVRIDLGRGPVKKRIGWADRAYIDGADGAVGPGGLDDDVIRFVLRDAQAGERESVLPMIDGGGLFGGTVGLFGSIMLDGEAVRVRFDLRHKANVTNAGTALTLARVNAGTLAADRRGIEIAFGVERPVRRMTLATPLKIGALSIATIEVRTSDYGNADGIAAEGAPPSDPDEVVVTAKGKRDRITIGADALATCSSVVFDKKAKLIRLSCR